MLAETAEVSLDVLWRPIKIGRSTELFHRIIQSAHEQNYGGPDLLLGAQAIRYWEDRAKGGAALIITGAQTVHRSAFGHIPRGAEGWPGGARERYRLLADTLHPYGTKVFVQMGHWGCEDVGDQDLWNVRALWGPSNVGSMIFGEQTHSISREQIEELIEGYVATATNAQEGGCDGVELHAAHGYLIMQFLSPLYNHRTDQYGGSTENRCRLPIEIATAVRQRIGPDFPLGVRVCFDEMNPTAAGIDPAEGERIVRVLSATGLFDYFNVSAGAGYTAHKFIAPMTSMVQEPFAPYARRVKEIVDVPVFMAGRVTDIRRAAMLVSTGAVDVVAMTRAQIADPELVSKARSGRLADIRQCAGINQGCINRVFIGRQMSCTQNATVGRENEWGLGSLKPVEQPRRVLVVGGGPAGMKAAEIAAARGHRVTLCEREPALGGQLRLAGMLPSRTEWNLVIDAQRRALERHGVTVELGVEATVAYIEGKRPDALVIATGSRYDTTGWSITRGERAGIPGLEHAQVLTPAEVVRDPGVCGQDVLIVEEGGSYAPLGLAELLADLGRSVRIVSSALFIGDKTVASLDMPIIYPRLAAKGVVLQPQTFVEQVNADGSATLSAMWSGATERVTAATIVLALNRSACDDLYHEMGSNGFATIDRIGDCVAPRKADQAFYDGERLGREL